MCARVVSAPTFELRSDVYDALINWTARLAGEAPFYRTLFKKHHVHTVLDAACGSGRHAAMFRDWGLLVEGADQSAEMIARARETYGDSDELRWTQRSFDTRRPTTSFDAAICVGNSLSLAADLAMVKRTVGALLSAVRPGGIVVLHVLNLWSLPDGPVTWQRFKRVAIDGADHLLAKGVHRAGGRGFIDLLDFRGTDAAPAITQAEFLGLRFADLRDFAHDAGAASVVSYGDYSFCQFDEDSSADLIVIIRRHEYSPQC